MPTIIELNQQYGYTMENTIFMTNKYGYQIDISNPRIAPLYISFKIQKKLPLNMPISDKERFEFEALVFKMLEKTAKEKQLIPTVESMD